jgi:hypothetical protein
MTPWWSNCCVARMEDHERNHSKICEKDGDRRDDDDRFDQRVVAERARQILAHGRHERACPGAPHPPGVVASVLRTV